jgi:uncharacterized membrane protein YfcA
MGDGGYYLAGAVTGFTVGLTGVGGGALMTPILLWLFRINPSTAVATDLWFAVLTKLAAAAIHYRAGFVDWLAVRRLWCGSLPVTLVVSILVSSGWHGSRVAWLTQAIGCLVIVTALGLLVAPLISRRLLAGGAPGLNPRREPGPAWTVLAGLVLGLCVSLTSVGAGALGSVMLLYLYPRRMTPHALVATDIVHAIPMALVAGIGYLVADLVDLHILLQLVIGSIPAAVAGSLLAKRFRPRWLQIVLAICLLGIGVKTI